MLHLLLGVGLLLTVVPAAQAQPDWDALRQLPKGSRLGIRELSGYGHADGRLALVDDDELTILKRGRAVVVPKALIGRIDHRKSDSPIEGALLGALVGVAAYFTYVGQGCSEGDSSCFFGAVGVYAGLGAFIDWRIQNRQTIYRAPKLSTVTLMQLRFWHQSVRSLPSFTRSGARPADRGSRRVALAERQPA